MQNRFVTAVGGTCPWLLIKYLYKIVIITTIYTVFFVIVIKFILQKLSIKLQWLVSFLAQ